MRSGDMKKLIETICDIMDTYYDDKEADAVAKAIEQYMLKKESPRSEEGGLSNAG